METIDPVVAVHEKCTALDVADDRLAREIFAHLADKWSLWVLHVLDVGGRLRFTRVLEQVEGVSQKMLTKTLRQLERDGLVTRTMYMEVPPRVEYELAPPGRQFLLRMLPLWTWVVENVEGFRAALSDSTAKSRRKHEQ